MPTDLDNPFLRLAERYEAEHAAVADPASLREELESDWRLWVPTVLPLYFPFGFARHHAEFWEWLWAIERTGRPHPKVALWSRGGAKSTTAEGALVALGARRKRRYALYCSMTQDQADKHIASIASMLESPEVQEHYPTMGRPQLGKFGNSKGWRRNRLRTAAGFTVDALGLDSAQRGARVDEMRPDVLCHEVGTEIYDEHQWMNVEDHPGLLGFREEEATEVRVWGVPGPECVTSKHLYWARKIRRGIARDPEWTTAADICEWLPSKSHGVAIGWKIPTEVRDVPPVVIGRSKVRRRTADGFVEQSYVDHYDLVEELSDPEWWWLVGLWWGDGTSSRGGGNGHAIGLALADTQPEIAERVRNVLKKWGYGWHERQGEGCKALTFSCKWMFLWTIEQWRILTEEGAYRPGQKKPPQWVEGIDPSFQAALLRGYADADGYITDESVRVTSVSLDGLLSARRMLARLGIASSIRHGPNGDRTEHVVMGRSCFTQKRWDLRVKDGVSALGFTCRPITRNNRPSRVWIEDGWLWSSVRSAEVLAETRKFAPIRTASGTYDTHFGLSHNCVDDIDDPLDTAAAVKKKIEVLTKSVLPLGTPNMVVIAIQNLIHEGSVFAQLAGIGTQSADFLADRLVSGPIPALEGMEWAERDGKYVITAGTPTWTGQDLVACQQMVDTYGLTAFLSECQHETTPPAGGMFDHLIYRRIPWSALPRLIRTTVWVDPAVTDTDQSDSQGIQADGLGIDGKVYRLFSWEQRTSPQDAIRRALRKAVELEAVTLGVETDQGGDTWSSVVAEEKRWLLEHERMDCSRVQFVWDKAGAGHGPKTHRASLMLTDYERGGIVHVEGTHTVLERALHRFPKLKPYDLVDASYWAWQDLRGGTSSGTYQDRRVPER